MLRLAWREKNQKVRIYYLFVLLIWVPLVATFHAICFFLDGLIYPELRRVQVKRPVFVVGHARSGTTLVHRLMSQDGERFSSFLLWELYFPSLLQKKVIRWVAAVDARSLGGFLGRRVDAFEARRYGAMKGAHEMSLRQPEEDDIIGYYSCASGYWITKMPYMGDLDFFYVDRWPARRRKRLMRFYADCVRRQLYLNGRERTHLSKNPVFAGRLEALIETFPDARFIVPVRDPGETIPSLLKLMKMGWQTLGWEAERMQPCLRVLAEQSFDTYLYPFDVLAQHPETSAAVVDYRALLADPAATVAGIYDDLGLEMSDGYRARLQAEGGRARSHVGQHVYSLAEFGLEADVLEARLASLFERFQWNSAGSSAESAREN